MYYYLGPKVSDKIIKNEENEDKHNKIKQLIKDYSFGGKNKQNIKILSNEEEILENHFNIEKIKPRSYTLDRKKNKDNPIKINFDNFYFNDNKIFLRTNILPKIIPKLSLSNFNKRKNNNNEENNELNNNKDKKNKFNIFNKTYGITDLKQITFNKGITSFRNTNYKLNNINTINTINTINNLNINDYLNDTFKYKLLKEKLLNINKLQNNNNIKIINKNIIFEKDKKKLHFNKNFFNSKTIINKKINLNLKLLKNKKRESIKKNDNKLEIKRIKNDLYEDNNDSFINELNYLFLNDKENNDNKSNNEEQLNQIDKTNESDDDKSPDPRINFEHINKVNKSRPQTSYGGLNARRKNLQNAFKNKDNRPVTSNLP